MIPYCQCTYKDREIEDNHCVSCGLEVDPEYFDALSEKSREMYDEIQLEEESNN